MLLRPRQKQFVERSLRALDEHTNTLGVAPTGAGKTIMLSAVVRDRIGVTPACGLAGATPEWARTAIGLARRAAELFAEDPDAIE